VQLYVISVFVIAFVVALFAMQNSEVVTLMFLSWEFDASLIVVIVGCVALGSILMGLLGGIAQFRLNLKLRGARRTVAKLEERISELETERDDLKQTAAELEQELMVAFANEAENCREVIREVLEPSIRDSDEDEFIDAFTQTEHDNKE
jgi:putative membrane protein